MKYLFFSLSYLILEIVSSKEHPPRFLTSAGDNAALTLAAGGQSTLGCASRAFLNRARLVLRYSNFNISAGGYASAALGIVGKRANQFIGSRSR